MEKDIRENKRFGKQFSYVLDCIKDPNGERMEMTDSEKVALFVETFNAEYNTAYEKRRYPNLSERIGNYLQGLPSVCVVDFDYCRISEIGRSWGFCKTERAEAQFIDNWFNTLGFRLSQMAKYYGIELR